MSIKIQRVTISDEPGVTWVLKLDVVRWAIRQLILRRVHPFFLAYLHLRSCAVDQGSESDIHPRWNELGRYLEVPGGPPKKPFYRPLFDPPGNPSRYWLNENLAGSFAPSSLREGMPPMRVVMKGERGAFALRPDHAQLALQHLLHEDQMPVYPFAAFLYRDFGVITEGPRPEPVTLVDMFKEDWHFTENEDPHNDFGTLFKIDNVHLSFQVDDAHRSDEWFEKLPVNEEET